MKYLLVSMMAIFMAVGIVLGQEPATYDWTGMVEINIFDGEHLDFLAMPTPAPKRTNIFAVLQIWNDLSEPGQDGDNEYVRGSVWGTGESFLQINENIVRGGGDEAANKKWSNINLNVPNPEIRITHGNYSGSGNFYFNAASFSVHAWKAEITPDGPIGQ